MKARDRAREIDKQNEITLRKKYHLYAESSDVETNNNNTQFSNHNYNQQPSTSRNYRIYTDHQSLHNNTKRDSNIPDSVKLEDLNAIAHHRRTSSDSSRDKGAFVHVRNKKKAPPPPPLELRAQSVTPKTLSGRRRKRQAPPPPISPTTLEDATSATSLLGDKEIQAIIQGTTSLVKNTTTLSSPIVSTALESPIMEKKKIYVSPYLKIREDRKLTDEQKRILLEQVTKNNRKSEERLTPATLSVSSSSATIVNTNSIEKGQLNFPKADSPKLTRDDRNKVFAPSSPISPRPWYKRSTNTNSNPKEVIPFKKEVILRTLEKRKHKKDDKDLPEVGYSRNSFFDSASKFNIFAKLGDDTKKKEREAEKRKSLIGIPNISELDREAAEIIQRGAEASKVAQKMNDIINESTTSLEKSESPTARDLIQKFEANLSQINKITVNSEIAGTRSDLFGKNQFSFDERDIREASPTVKIKINSNGIKKSHQEEGLLGLWKCASCTSDNPNWKIICESCGKIKPYEKRFCVNGELMKKASPLQLRKFTYENNSKSGEGWERKSELVKKYFQPQMPKPMDLSKSPSESFIGNSLSKKSPSPTRRYLGSPKLPPRKSSLEKAEAKVDTIKEEVVIFPPIKSDKKLTPNLNELRNARLARFNTSLDIKRHQPEIERQNANATDRKQSPEKKFPEKLDFSDPAALEREKERLRDKIRAMNARALAEKYPVASDTPITQPIMPQQAQENTKLGAIKKVFKKPLENNRDEIMLMNGFEEEKIINSDTNVINSAKEKREKISISVQTTLETRPRKKSEDFSLVPMTVVEFHENGNIDDKSKASAEKVNEKIGSVYSSNTLAINKILRKLENAIADGMHDEAANFAKDLAKLKVPLSVTRQRERPKSDMEMQLSKLK